MLKKSIILTPEIIKTLKLDLIFFCSDFFKNNKKINCGQINLSIIIDAVIELKKYAAFYVVIWNWFTKDEVILISIFERGLVSRVVICITLYLVSYINSSGVTDCYNYCSRVTYYHEVCLLMWIRNNTEVLSRLWMDRNKLEHNIVCYKTGWFSRFPWPGDFRTFHHSVRVLGLTNINHAPQRPSRRRITTLEGSH